MDIPFLVFRGHQNTRLKRKKKAEGLPRSQGPTSEKSLAWSNLARRRSSPEREAVECQGNYLSFLLTSQDRLFLHGKEDRDTDHASITRAFHPQYPVGQQVVEGLYLLHSSHPHRENYQSFCHPVDPTRFHEYPTFHVSLKRVSTSPLSPPSKPPPPPAYIMQRLVNF